MFLVCNHVVWSRLVISPSLILRSRCLVQAEGDRLTAERIMLHKTRADMAAQLARLKAIQVGTLPPRRCAGVLCEVL